MTRHSLRALAVPAFWLALLFAVTMALVPQPPALPGDPSDKLQHVAAFLVLTWLAVMAYPRAPLLRLGLGLAAVGLLIEVAQAIPALHRDSDLLDLAADSAAIAVGLAVVSARRRRRSGDQARREESITER